MRILAFSNCPLDPLLGSGQTRLAWSEGLRQRGHEVRVWDSVALLGASSRPFGRRWRLALAAGWKVATEDLSRIDLIEFYGAEFWLPTWWLARRSPQRRPLLIAHSDGLEPAYGERLERSSATKSKASRVQKFVATLNQLAFSRSDGFVTGSESDRKFAVSRDFYPEDRAIRVSLGLKPEFLREPVPLPDDPHRGNSIVFLGRWSLPKGHRWVVEATRELLAQRPGLRLQLLGVAVDEATVKQDFPPEVRPQIEVRPRLSPVEIRSVFARAKVFFQATEFEGFGLALAEAMACGCAAVTTPTGFGAELADGVEALICDFGDVAAMRNGLTLLLDDDARRFRIATAGQQRARTLRWETSVARLEEIYLRWLRESPRAHAPS